MKMDAEILPLSSNECDARLMQVTAEYVKTNRMNLTTAKRILQGELKNQMDFDLKTWSLFLILVNA